MKSTKYGLSSIFTGIKATWKLWLLLCEAKGINKVTRSDFTSRKTLNKLEPMDLECELKEAKFNWFGKKTKSKEPLML